MKAKSLLIGTVLALCGTGANAQWVVTDPGNLAQSIINMSDNIAHTSKTAVNTADSFAETVKIYEQAKKYYDQLKAVNDLIQDARKVRDIILMVGDVSDIYVTNFGKMMNDENFSPRELDAIAFGYTRLLEESNGVLQDLKQVINVSTLVHDRQGPYGRGGQLLLRDAPLPQPCELLYDQEHSRKLPQGQKEERPGTCDAALWE